MKLFQEAKANEEQSAKEIRIVGRELSIEETKLVSGAATDEHPGTCTNEQDCDSGGNK